MKECVCKFITKDGNGTVLDWIYVGFGSSGFEFRDDFSATVFGNGLNKMTAF